MLSFSSNIFLVCFLRSLPTTIDCTVAMNSIRSQRNLLFNLIRHDPLSLANSLYSKFMISQNVCDDVCNQSLGISCRVNTLLNCMEDRVKASPSDFTEVVHILEADSFLRPGAEELVKSYCEWEHGCGLSLVSSFLWILKSGPARILTFSVQGTLGD